MGSSERQLWRREQQRKADGAVSPAWVWSDLLRKTSRCTERLTGLRGELVTQIPRKDIWSGSKDRPQRRN